MLKCITRHSKKRRKAAKRYHRASPGRQKATVQQMKKTLLLLATTLFLTGCLTKQHKFASVTISELVPNEGGYPHSILNICLMENVGYSTYNVDIVIVTSDGTNLDGQLTLYGGNDSNKKCFDFWTTSFLANARFSKPEHYEKVAKVYKGNIKSISLKIHEQNSDEIIDQTELSSL